MERGMQHRVTPCEGRDEAFHNEKLRGENIRMYSTPKIIASLDANIVLATALGHWCEGGSNVTWDR